MKPHIYRRSGRWYCTGRQWFHGYGLTAVEAYRVWQSKMREHGYAV
jgi:hypothetical protein